MEAWCWGLQGHAGAAGFTSGKLSEDVVTPVFKNLLVSIQSGVHWLSGSASHMVFVLLKNEVDLF